MARPRVVAEQIKEIEAARLQKLEREPVPRPHAMVRLLARVVGIGVETADMLVHEVCRATSGTGGLWRATPASPGRRTRAGQAAGERARQGRQRAGAPWHDPAGVAISLFQKDSALARWYRARTEGARGGMRKTLIVALARKLRSRCGGW